MIHLPINDTVKVLADLTQQNDYSDISVYNKDDNPSFLIRKTKNSVYFIVAGDVDQFSLLQITVAKEIMQHFNLYENFLKNRQP